MLKPLHKSKSIHKYVLYYLIAVIGMNLSYPISAYGPAMGILYQLIVTATFIFGVIMVNDNKWLFRFALTLAILATTAGIPFNTLEIGKMAEVTDHFHLLIVSVLFGGFTLFQILLVIALFRYMFSANHVSKDIIYSAIAVYLLIATSFATLYRLVEVFNPHSFIVSYATGVRVEWQDLVYYSYVTLTTLGYGDILPNNLWAKSMVSMEAVVGVMYIAILVSRLVSLYQHNAEVEN